MTIIFQACSHRRGLGSRLYMYIVYTLTHSSYAYVEYNYYLCRVAFSDESSLFCFASLACTERACIIHMLADCLFVHVHVLYTCTCVPQAWLCLSSWHLSQSYALSPSILVPPCEMPPHYEGRNHIHVPYTCTCTCTMLMQMVDMITENARATYIYTCTVA